ncbi:Phosphatidylinositol 4-kinase lsb6 [Apiospora saccharicola]|uniref:Phosphatidylinositol 4-kinase n=1 Tax=Apiospora saccharicola TaxID=335842 RepID=A0ABR1UL46_9PEZI
MPRHRPPTTGYERLAQAEDPSDDSEDDPLGQSFASLQPQSAPRFAPISQPRPHSGMASPKTLSKQRYRPQRARSNSGVDLKAINARLERWAEEIAAKFKRTEGKGKGEEEESLEIHYSVFHAPDGVRPFTASALAANPYKLAMSEEEFESIVESVRSAIDQGMHPSMITQGSSGSYFARNMEGKIVGVFKPKDEEPYAAGNPKWNKWIHRNLFPCCFGRACLIPNLSYVSEAAAYTLDCQLRTHMVPYTDVVWLSSKSFHYPYWDRRNFYRKKKAFPAKPGSFQVFLKGFKDANVFLKQHPWPDQYWSGLRANDTHRNKQRRWADSCRPSSRRVRDDESDDDEARPLPLPPGPDNFVWTEGLKQAFREELEKLVILDYIMRNTDRGLDNWMVKVDWETQAVSIASEPPQLHLEPDEENDEPAPRPVNLADRNKVRSPGLGAYHTQKPMQASSPRSYQDPHISIGAIDNSLSWPWKHPDAWRSFPFGWLFLPVDLIGRPFSQKTKDHFLPLLTSTAWWSETQLALRKVFQLDPDFQEKMFARQMAVMKGQAWNVVETLKTADHGPLELTRRVKVCVWDDLVDVPIAVPMRAASTEARRKAEPELRDAIEEEIDIGAAISSTAAPKQTDDLLGFASPLPNPGRFELSTPRALSPEPEPAAGGETSPPNGKAADPFDELHGGSDTLRPKFSRMAPSRTSYHGPSRTQGQMYSPHRERRFSFTTAAGRRNSNSIATQMYGSQGGLDDEDGDLEGDLGFAAAEGAEGNRRKVIVERLETVKARNPVFTWC